MKTTYYTSEIRQLRASNKMFLERIKSVCDEEGMLLESDINDIFCKGIAKEKYFDSLDPDSPPSPFKGGKKEEALCNDKTVLKYILKVSR